LAIYLEAKMIKTEQIKDAKFVFSKDEVPYQEIIDHFKNAEFINILTYNISANNNLLLNQIKDLEANVNVKIISNIPGRFENYYHSTEGQRYRKAAKKKIEVYMNKLNPEEFQQKMSTFFCFSNHSKIIMTNNIIYIGSANSEESSNNFEAGIISRD
jgi:hypothetical protein